MHTVNNDTGAGVPAFLAKLWRLVEDSSTNHLITWNSDGRSFIIHDQAQFAKELLPLNYKHNNMASFIRQLNMYGFHKITSLENGGLKFDRDEMEFCHPCFQRGHSSLLEHIKRKIANSKAQDEKVNLKPETLTRVLSEVKMMRGKQESLDNRFSSMKQENEALWREVVVLRQKHMKQQQIVNKLIQFLVTIVQPSRGGLGNMGVKRRYPLMINEAPTASKIRKPNTVDYGPIIHELAGDEPLEEDLDYDFEDTNPIVVQNPRQGSTILEIPKTPSSTKSHHDVEEMEDFVDENSTVDDDMFNAKQFIDELNVEMDKNEQSQATGKLAQKQMKQDNVQKRNQKKQPKVQGKQGSVKGPVYGKMVKQETSDGALSYGPIQEIDPNEFIFESIMNEQKNRQQSMPISEDIASTPSTSTQQPQDKTNWYANKEGFISNEMPSQLFDDPENSVGVEGNSSLTEGSFNPTLSEDLLKKIDAESADANQKSSEKKRQLTLARFNSNKVSDDDILSLHTPEDLDLHLGNVQTDLDTLREILKGDNYTVDSNALLGNGANNGAGQNINRFYMSPSLDNDYFVKLFADSDVLNTPYLYPSDVAAPLQQLQNEASSSSRPDSFPAIDNGRGKALLEYNNPQLDLDEILGVEPSDDFIVQEENSCTAPDLNTPQGEN